MKKFSRLFAVLMVLLLVVATVPAVSAAGTEPGKTATVTFTFADVYGVNGFFSFSNADIITGVQYSSNVSCRFENSGAMYHGAEEVDVTITLTCAVSAAAKDGDTCVVTFAGDVSNGNGDVTAFTKTGTITVEVPEDDDDQGGNQGGNQGGTGDTTTDAVDYTELNKQLAIAKEIKNEGYSAASWSAFEEALKAAQDALNSKDQKVVDEAAAALADAIQNLTKLNYQPLIDAIDKTEQFLGKDELGGKINGLIDALTAARDLLGNAQDQESIDKAAENLTKALEELEALLKQMQENKGVTQIEVAPKGEYCNISIHYVWPILFFISLAVNVIFVTMAVLYFVRRKRNEADETPLVNYEIGDDE